MIKLSSSAGRKWGVLACLAVILMAMFTLDSYTRFSGKSQYLYNSASWISQTTNAFRNATKSGVWGSKRILNMGRQAIAGITPNAHQNNATLDIVNFLKINSTEHKNQSNSESASTVTTIINPKTGAYRFPYIPGLYSMDENLSLPPKIPFRPNSNEPILQYSQKRDYKALISHDDKCGAGKVSDLTLDNFDYNTNAFMLIIIKSACKLKARRDAIRNTWGNEIWIKENVGVIVKRIFLLGSCENAISRDQVIEEDKMHGDILQWDFHDSFRNLTLKDVLFLQWYAKNCQNVPFIFKGDDDIFANVRNIVESLKNFPLTKRNNLFEGSVLRRSPRILNPHWKYYVSYNLYPDKLYPPYVSGGGFVMSSPLAVKLFQASLSTRLIPIDDAFLGILLKKIGVQPTNERGYKSWGMKKHDICRLAKIKTYHKILPEELEKIWKEYITLNVATCPRDTDDVFRTQMKRK